MNRLVIHRSGYGNIENVFLLFFLHDIDIVDWRRQNWFLLFLAPEKVKEEHIWSHFIVHTDSVALPKETVRSYQPNRTAENTRALLVLKEHE